MSFLRKISGAVHNNSVNDKTSLLYYFKLRDYDLDQSFLFKLYTRGGFQLSIVKLAVFGQLQTARTTDKLVNQSNTWTQGRARESVSNRIWLVEKSDLEMQNQIKTCADFFRLFGENRPVIILIFYDFNYYKYNKRVREWIIS